MYDINDRIKEVRKALGLSQKSFAEGIHRGRGEIGNIEYHNTEPKNDIIKSICQAYNVSEEWLRTGVGEMFLPENRDIEIAKFVGNALRKENADFTRRLIAVMARLDSEDWKLLERMAAKLAEEEKKESQD